MAITREQAEAIEEAQRRAQGLGWATGHRLTIHNQIESRPGPVQDDGTSWLENRSVGMVHLLCNCGYSSGWIPRDQMPGPDQLKAEHGVPFEALIIW
ncbi:hypothetical protein [Streptomyces sp. YKOK-I1]